MDDELGKAPIDWRFLALLFGFLTHSLNTFQGFGDAVNNTECWAPVIDYVEKQFDKYLDAETRVERFPVVDSRVHACLYFIAPSGHGLKPLDIEFMRRIHERVSIGFFSRSNCVCIDTICK